VLEVVETFGDEGCISDQIEDSFWPRRRHSVTPRVAPLKRKGLVSVIGKRLGGVKRFQQVIAITPKGKEILGKLREEMK
jgi:DNA-binding PadR family transcriptional regulator